MKPSVHIRQLLVAGLAAAVLVTFGAPSATGAAAPASAAKKKCKGKKAKKKKKCKKQAAAPGIPPVTPPAGGGTTPQPTLPAVSGLTVTANPILAGSGTQGHVTIDAAAPAGGQTVTLLSSDPLRISVPASVAVTAGATSADFQITSTAGPDVTVTLTASIGASFATAQLTAKNMPGLAALVPQQRCITVGAILFPAGNVTLDLPAQGDTTVQMASSDPGALSVSNVTIPNGSTSAAYQVTALATATLVTLTGELNGVERTTTHRVRSPAEQSVLTGVSLDPPTVNAGGSSTGTVTLDCEALAGGAEVSLTSSHPDTVHVTPTVTVIAGQRTATFTVTTDPGAPASATITASYLGSTPQVTLTIN